MVVIRACGVVQTADLVPFGRVKFRKQGVALDLGIDLGDIEALGPGQQGLIDLRAADHTDLGSPVLLGLLAGNRDRLFQPLAGQGALGLKRAIARQHNIQTPGQGLERLGVPGRPAHDHRLEQGNGFEIDQIGLEPPRNTPLGPDHIVSGAGNDKGDWNLGHAHDLGACGQKRKPSEPQTAIGALIPAWA